MPHALLTDRLCLEALAPSPKEDLRKTVLTTQGADCALKCDSYTTKMIGDLCVRGLWF